MSDREGIPVPVVSGPDGGAKLPAVQRALVLVAAALSPWLAIALVVRHFW